MKRGVYCLLLAAGLLTAFGCTTLPEQPEISVSHAVLTFPDSMRLLAIDDRTLDTPIRVSTLRVHPGTHILRFEHINAGVDGSPSHAGQHAAPFALEVQEGVIYRFASKTCGLIWRPEVAERERIPGYCATHACTEIVMQKSGKHTNTANCK